MQPLSKRRLAGGAAALMLIGATLLSTAGSALAGQTRTITLGSPDSHGNVTAGLLTFTSATSGGATRTDITAINSSGHTLSNAHLLIGLDKVNNLPSDVKIIAVFGGDYLLCPNVTDPVTSLDCAFGNMAAKGATSSHSISVAFSVANAGNHDISVELKVSETGSDVGSNQNFAVATNTVSVGAQTCDALATFVPPNKTEPLLPHDATDCATDQQRSSLGVPPRAAGILVTLNDATPATGCGTVDCIGFQVSADVNGGASFSPAYITWTIRYSNTLLGNRNPNKVNFLHVNTQGTTPIPAANKGLCATDQVDCIASVTPDSTGVTFVLRTASNGVIKGR